MTLIYRYRGSTDDLRRSREDISVPSLIPKLLSTRGKEERLKRQDSKDDIRHSSKIARKDSSSKEENSKSSSLIVALSASKDESSKSGIRVFRRDNSREDVGRDSSNSIKEFGKGKQQEKQERTENVGGVARSRIAGEQNRTSCEDNDSKDDADDVEESSSKNAEVSFEQDEVILESRQDERLQDRQNARMFDVIITENRIQDERMQEKRTMVVGEEIIDAKYLLANREPVESIKKNDKQRDNDEEETTDITERLLDIGSDGDITGTIGERKGPLEIGYGKRPDEFQVVSEYTCESYVICMGVMYAGVLLSLCVEYI
jgi:hypothetical protein